ncbi:hypothetical protein AB0I60_00340 [Actinosynnema sp. NPDC050436]|uniref:hypothetical protein n=1 Tax=Actinosynnema sp. NPDC050436 TaxID=3155659 RepID=UPI0033D7E415
MSALDLAEVGERSAPLSEGGPVPEPGRARLLRPHVPAFVTVVALQVVGALSGLGHLLDGDVQLGLRLRPAAHLGRVPLGWFSRRRTGEPAKVVSAVHPFIAHAPGGLVSVFVMPVASLVYLLSGAALVGSGGLAPVDLVPFLLLGLGPTAPVAAPGHGFDDLQAAGRAVGRITGVLDEPLLPEPATPVLPQGHRVELRARWSAGCRCRCRRGSGSPWSDRRARARARCCS